jgi:hypothetical protein
MTRWEAADELDRLNGTRLDADQVDDLIDLLQRMIDGDPRNPDVLSWVPTLKQLQAQAALFELAARR